MFWNWKNFNEIVPGLFLGDEKALKNEEFMDKISLSVNCSYESNNNVKNIKISLKKMNDIKNGKILLKCGDEVIKKIHSLTSEGGNVFVYSVNGVQRGPSVIVMYLIKYYNFSFYESVEFIRARREYVFYKNRHNDNHCLFKTILIKYEHIIKSCEDGFLKNITIN